MPSRIRVWMIIDCLGQIGGGMELQAITLASTLRTMGIDVEYLADRADFSHLPVSEKSFIHEISNLPPWIPGRIAAIFSLSQNIWFLSRNRRDIDLIHAHSLTNGFVAGVVSKILKKPAIVKVGSVGPNGDIAKRQRTWLSGFRKKVLNNLDRIIAITPEIYEELVSAGYNKKIIQIIPNGVNTNYSQLIPVINSYVDDYENQSIYTAICVARFVPVKRLSLLIDAWRIIKDQLPNSKLILIGDGPLRIDIEKQISRLSLTDSIELVRNVDQQKVIQYLRQAKLFILPSESEGLSNAMLESLFCGVPVVTTETEGTKYLIKEGQTGVLIREPYDAQDLGNCVIRLFLDQNRLLKMGEEAHRDIEARFSINQVAKSYLDLYHELLRR
jgi:glycosyltransferase involved in cell wall biosynthesis